MINRRFFFDYVRTHLFDGRLRQSQVDGLTSILDEWEARHAKKDDRWLAYVLATAHHETDRKIQAIEEYGKGRGHPYGVPDPATGHTYYGRGLVQITWKANYEKLGRRLSVDLVNDPAKALDLAMATKIIFTGMIEGLFTGRKLSDYFNSGREDWFNARRIVNRVNRADLVASYAKSYYASISYTT